MSAMSRQLPRWSDLRPLLRMQPMALSATDRRLAAAANIADLRAIARRRTPRSVFDYVDGAAEGEISLARAREAFRRVEFHPQVLQDVSDVDTSTTILGRPAALPLILAPTGFTRMMHHEGESAVASVAARSGLPYALSTMGTTTVEDVSDASPAGDLWFQLYVMRDRGPARDLIARASSSGYTTLILTVDTAVGGARLRDVRNGLTIPPSLRLKTLGDMSLHPAWWFNVLTTEPLEFASMRSTGGTVADMIDRLFDPAVTYDDIDWLRGQWSGSLVVKGIQSVGDAVQAVEHGADAIVLSNHGGRQLDRAPTPLELLPRVLDAVDGRAEVYVDTGVTSGADILAAVGLGANAVMAGRAYLYGLMAGGERGVQRAVELLTAEFRRTQQLLGVGSLAELGPEQVTLRGSAE
ncbi:MAG: alpha-hydroxy acid oxidase [Nocardioidaceae bacterium]